MTLRQALAHASAQLASSEHLRANATRDAELLLLHTLHLTRATLLAHPDRELSAADQALYETLISRRLKNEPIQYITNQQEFYGLSLRVTSAVLIPRPETEHLVEALLQRLPHNQPLSIADIGTGSGAIAIALAVHLPQSRITALDISPEALKIAQANAETHNITHQIRLLHSDLLSAVSHEEPFDAIVSNPPYVPESDRPTLHPEVRDHEPSTALFSGPQGLDIYRRLIPQAHALLKPDGLLALEIGHGQREALTALLAEWRDITFVNDLQQIPRIVLATK
ncbi:MAG: peptide chain release factor N(5)-glutamine methyltransferase [Edaphobacter sp.]|nr:peptide chain release factor N(5)-glutamine methyltransferase [Edaphobacter sp.]